MKYFFLVLSLFVLAQPVDALTTARILNNGAPGRNVYSNDVEVLVLDVTIKPTTDDTLNTFVVENQGQPPAGIRIGGLSLWKDASEPGYQGWEQDALLATTTDRDGERWTFQNLSIPVATTGTRLFVTMTVYTIRGRLFPIQFGIPQWTDLNRNGKFDSGDAGVFFNSQDNGPMDGAVMNPDLLFLNPAVSFAIPAQSAITLPAAGGHVPVGSVTTITGKSRTRAGGTVSSVHIRIGSADTIATLPWKTVQSTGVQFGSWEYAWTPTAAGTVRVETRANDNNGVSEEPHGITLVADPTPAAPGVPGSPYANMRIEVASSSAVYYVGPNGKRYAFPNANTYHSWYPDFTGITVVSVEQLAQLPLGGVVAYRPGTRLIKLQTDPRVYAVSQGALLRWVSTEETAKKLFGVGWPNIIDDCSDAFFSHYTLGEPLTEHAVYDSIQQQAVSPTIAKEKGL